MPTSGTLPQPSERESIVSDYNDRDDREPISDEELLAQADARKGSAESWDPAPGEAIVGTIVRTEHPKVPNTDRVLPILVLETGDGEERVAVKHDVLKSELLGQQAQTGDRVAIRYLGPVEGRRYRGYKVAVHHSGSRDGARAFTATPADPDGLTDEARGDDSEDSTW